MKFSIQRNNCFLAILLTILMLNYSVECKTTVKFKSDFPDNKLFTQKDTFTLDLSKYVQGTFNVDIQADEGFQENVQFKKPLADIFSDPSIPLVDRDCRSIHHIETKRDFFMLCGKNGFNLVYLDINDVNLNLKDTRRLNIKADPMTQNLSIKRCFEASLSQKSNNGYIVCESSVPKGKEDTISPKLYLMAFSFIGELKVKTVKVIEQQPSSRLNGDLDIVVHSIMYKDDQDKDRVKDVVNIVEKLQFGEKAGFQSWAMIYDRAEFDEPSRINKDLILNYLKEPTDALYELIPGANEIWLVFKRTPKSEEGTDITSFSLLNCGLPKVIKEEPRQVGLECQRPVDIVELPSSKIEGSKFLFTIIPGSRLDPNSNSDYELVTVSKIGLWAGDLKLNSETDLFDYSQTVEYTDDERLNVIKTPLNSYIIDDKIYFSTTAQDEDEKETEKLVTKIFVYYNSNQALSDAYEPFDGDGTMFVRDSRYAGDYHELFFLGNKLSSYAGIETHQFGVEFSLTYNDEESNADKREITATFTIPSEDEDQKQRLMYFTILKNVSGSFSSSLDGRAIKVYTGSPFRLPTYVSDFSGNNVYFEANTDYENPETKKKLELLISYKGKRDIEIEKEDEEKLAFSNIKSGFYLNEERYVFLDGKKGLMLIACNDKDIDDPTTKITCSSIANVPFTAEAEKDQIPGNQLITAYPGSSRFYTAFKNTEENKSYIYMRDYNDALFGVGKSFAVDFDFTSAGIFIHNGIVYIYMVSAPNAQNDGEVKVITFEESDDMPEKLEVLDVYGIPTGQICPYKLEFFPHKTPEFVLGSSCKEGDTKINRIFQFKIQIDRNTNKYTPQRVNLTTSHNVNNFVEAGFCLTDGYVHVFETKEQPAENASMMRSYVASETDGSSIYIPLRETNSESPITHVNSFYCDRYKNAVVLSINQKLGEVNLTGIVTIDSNQITNPNKRIHSVYAENSTANLNVVAGSNVDHDQLIILATTETSTKFISSYASLDGPHFRYTGYDLNTPTKEEIKVNISMKNSNKVVATAISRIMLDTFDLGGKISFKGSDKPEITELSKKGTIVSMPEMFTFEGAVLNLQYKSNLKDADSQGKSEEDNNVVPLVQQNKNLWQKVFKDVTQFDVENDYAIYVSPNDDNSEQIASIVKGAKEDTIQVQETINMDEIYTAKILKSNDKYCGIVIGKKDSKLNIVVSAEKSNGTWSKSKPNVATANYPEEIRNAIIRHSPVNKDKNIIVLNIIGMDNTDNPQIVSFSVTYNPDDESSSLIGFEHVSFDEPIVSFSASFSFEQSSQLTQEPQPENKMGAIVVVALESRRELKFLGFTYNKFDGVLQYTKVTDDKFVATEKSQILSHQNSVLDCDPILKPEDGSNELEMQCLIATADTVSAIFKAQIVAFADEREIKRVVEGDLFLETQIQNLRYFVPNKAIRDGDNVMIMARRLENAPITKDQNYVGEDWLILFYRLNLSTYPVHILKPSDFKVKSGKTINSKLISIVHQVNDKRSDHFFITVYNPSQTRILSQNNSTKMFSKRISQSTVPVVYAYDVNQTYRWNIKSPKLISPQVDQFSFNTFKSSTPSSTVLRDITTNKDDPYQPDPKPKDDTNKTHWVIWVCIIVVVALIAGGVVYAIMSKTDEDDYDNLVVVDGEGENEGYKQIEDDKTLTESEYSRL